MTQPDTIAITKSFRLAIKPAIPYYLIILPCIFILGVITKPNYISTWPLILTLMVVLVLYSVLVFTLTVVEIDVIKKEVVLIETNVLKKKKINHYPLKEVQFTYKKSKTGLYSRLVNICRLYLKDKKLIAVIPDRDGWTDDTVNDLAKGLVNAGVPKKFIGYSLIDAEINGLL